MLREPIPKGNHVGLLLALLLLPALACNAFAGRTDSFLPPPPTITPVPDEVEDGQLPNLAPTVTLPPDPVTPVQGTVRILVDLNIRDGPGIQYERVGFLAKDEIIPVIGRDEPSGWWQIPCPPEVSNQRCWISGGAQYTRYQAATPVP